MTFRQWLQDEQKLENSNPIAITSINSYGDVTVNIDGKRYQYHTFDAAFARKLYDMGRYRPGKVLNILKKFKFTPLTY